MVSFEGDTVGGALAGALRGAGVPRVFGIPGGGSAIDLIEACRAVGLPFTLTQHETTAAMSAIVAGELTGSCGVCVSIMGPGATNLAGGASFGLWERHALLCLTEAYPAEVAERMSLQRMSHAQLFMSFSKRSETLSPIDPAAQAASLMAGARDERPGPVHLDLPNGMLELPAQRRPQPQTSKDASDVGLVGDVDALADAINKAGKPVVVAGPAVARAGASNELVELAERIGAAVVTTSKARGVIPEDHPLAAGVLTGVYGAATFEGRIIGQSDLIIAVGLDRMELLSPWAYPQAMVAVDAIDPGGERVGAPARAVYGPLPQALSQLAQAVRPAQAWRAEELRRFWDSVRAALGSHSSEFNSSAILERAQKLLPADTILVAETGIYNAVNLFTWKVGSPDRYFGSSGANTMGFSLPAAIATSLIRPDRSTLALVGDGGFLMKASELETIAREGLSPIIIVFNDRSLGLIRVKQAAKGYHRDAVDLAPVDIAGLARSFGGSGHRVSTIEAFDAALRASLDGDRFAVIDARLDPDAYAADMIPIRG